MQWHDYWLIFIHLDKSKVLPNVTIMQHISKYGLLLAFVLICTILSFLTANFFSVQNFVIVLRQISINGILAVGVTFVIICGGIDLSLGSVLALTGVVAALFAQNESYGL